jgi:small multidrug resistance family-3 protein
MRPLTALGLLFVAAWLEAGGDALIRLGLQSQKFYARAAWILAGGSVLIAYGLAVNAPAWDFGRLLGVYVTMFFVIAQAVNWALFGVLPGPPVLFGGALIVAGGLVMTFWRV